MTKTIKIGFDESSKAVTAHVTIESDEMTADELLAETHRVMTKATELTSQMSLKKLI